MSSNTTNPHLKTNNQANKAANANPLNDIGFDYKTILYRFLAFWPIITTTVLIALIIAWLFNRYATPRYVVGTTILINEESQNPLGGGGSEGFTFNLFQQDKTLDNEIGLMKSYGIARNRRRPASGRWWASRRAC